MPDVAVPWPRLSETLPGPKDLVHCWSCGAAGVISVGQLPAPPVKLDVWQEHDERDRPEAIPLLLCAACADKIIENHPRLYDRLPVHAPFPGAMPACVGCRFSADGAKCAHPALKANGGAGLALSYPHPTVAHVDGRDKSGRRFGRTMAFYHGPVICRGREEASGA